MFLFLFFDWWCLSLTEQDDVCEEFGLKRGEFLCAHLQSGLTPGHKWDLWHKNNNGPICKCVWECDVETWCLTQWTFQCPAVKVRYFYLFIDSWLRNPTGPNRWLICTLIIASINQYLEKLYADSARKIYKLWSSCFIAEWKSRSVVFRLNLTSNIRHLYKGLFEHHTLMH